MAREPVRGARRSVANLEFHRAGEEINEVGAAIVAKLEVRGIRAVNPSMGFPMEMYQAGGGAIWVVSHKPVAVEAGLGHMGIHRNLIHPKFGNFVLLGTILIGCEASDYDHPLAYNPCLECKLCVAACPVGAIGPEGSFNFSSCFTHNYREFLGGFSDWIEQIADARNAIDYRRRINDSETSSMWQSLSHGANYKSAYCMAVCPAGEDVIGRYLQDPQRHLQEVVKPLQERAEPVYVVPGSDAEAVARRKFKNKTVKPVGNGLRPRSISGLLNFMPFVFQPNQSRGLDATFHFTFTGAENRNVTIKIHNRTLEIKDGLVGEPGSMSRQTRKPGSIFSRKEELDRGCDRKKGSREREPKAAPGLWQMLSHHRCTARARGIKTTIHTNAPRSCPLCEERSGDREDQMARQTQARGNRASHSQCKNVSLQAARPPRHSLRLPARTVLDAPCCAAGHSDQSLLHHRLVTHLA